MENTLNVSQFSKCYSQNLAAIITHGCGQNFHCTISFLKSNSLFHVMSNTWKSICLILNIPCQLFFCPGFGIAHLIGSKILLNSFGYFRCRWDKALMELSSPFVKVGFRGWDGSRWGGVRLRATSSWRQRIQQQTALTLRDENKKGQKQTFWGKC